MRMRKSHIRQTLLIISIVSLFLTGCGESTQQSTATVTLPAIPTVSPTVSDTPSVPPTEIIITSSPTQTPMPSPTTGPKATPVPTATPTPEPTVAPTAVPVGTAMKVPVVISGLDKKSECVSVRNTSDKDIDLTGWYILSVTGNQRFNFPDGYTIKAGTEVKVASFEATGDLFWTKANMWNNSKSDPAEFYNAEGILQSRWDD